MATFSEADGGRAARRPPQEWLLRCLKAGHGKGPNDDFGAWRTLSPDNWEALAKEAAYSGLEPLLYRYFSGPGEASGIPAPVLESMRGAYLVNAAMNLQRYGELRKILAAFRSHGLPVIVLKGAFLAEAVYRNIALRPMSDVDLLVEKSDLPRADRILAAGGFRPREGALKVAAEGYDFHYIGTQTGVLVELHWDIISPRYPFTVETASLWRNARPCTIQGIETLALDPIDLMLHLCLHTAIHMFLYGIVSLCDIAEILAAWGDGWDWERFLDRARQWGVTRSAYLTLLLAKRLLSVDIPEKVLGGLRPSDFKEAHFEAARDAALPNRPEHRSGAALRPSLALFWGKKGFWEKASLFLHRVFPSPEIIAADPGIRSTSTSRPFLYGKWIALLVGRNAHQVRRLALAKTRLSKRPPQEARLAALMNWLIAP